MSPFRRLATAITLLAFARIVVPSPASAGSSAALADTAWARCGVPLSTGPGDREGLVSLADGAGGAFVLWQRLNPVSFATDLYGQHVDATGAIVAGWTANGLALCAAPGDQSDIVAAPDGVGGGIAAWTDQRADSAGRTHPAIFALRIASDGAPVVGWSAGGVAVAPGSRPETRAAIASDGAGGAFVAWQQPVAGDPAAGEIALQHLLADGSVAVGWPDSGIVVATGADPRGDATVVLDGAGGCVVAWDDGRGADEDIYTQRVTAAGAALWTANGVLACDGANDQLTPRGVSDGAGGIVIAMESLSAGDLTSVDLVAQRIDATGARPAGWPSGGVAICSAGDAQINHRIVTDGAGGALVSWDDYRSGTTRVYLQHVQANGAIAPGFVADGNGVSNALEEQSENDLVSDGTGGALVAWTQAGVAVGVLRAQGDGSLASGWDASGLLLCPANPQFTPSLASDGSHGAIVSFLDLRSGSTAELYAAHVTHDANVPTLMALASLESSPTEVTLAWYGARATGPFTLWRQRASDAWQSLASISADGSGFVRHADRDVRAGETLTYRLTAGANFGAAIAADVRVEVPASIESRPPRLTPNPATGSLTVELALARDEDVRWTLFDVAGRRVTGASLGRLAAGVQRRALAGTAALPAGVYTLRVARDDRVESARACVVR